MFLELDCPKKFRSLHRASPMEKDPGWFSIKHQRDLNIPNEEKAVLLDRPSSSCTPKEANEE
jgi:hypothetical protein